jgi:hypothetical protein
LIAGLIRGTDWRNGRGFGRDVLEGRMIVDRLDGKVVLINSTDGLVGELTDQWDGGQMGGGRTLEGQMDGRRDKLTDEWTNIWTGTDTNRAENRDINITKIDEKYAKY